MTISSVTASPYTNLLSDLSATPGNPSVTDSSVSLESELLAATVGTPATTSSEALLQDMVTLSPQAMGYGSISSLTYNAQGLLQALQSNQQASDPLLQSSTDMKSLIDSGLLATAPATYASAMQNGVDPSATTSTDANSNWAQLLKSNPSLAEPLIQHEIDQGIISMLA